MPILEVPKCLHFVLLGGFSTDGKGEINDIRFDYLKQWVTAHPNYEINFWYDSTALLIEPLQKAIQDFSYGKASEAFNQQQFEKDFERFYNEQITKILFTTQQQAEQYIKDKLANVVDKQLFFDEAALDFVKEKLNVDTTSLKQLREYKSKSYATFFSAFSAVKPKEINNFKEELFAQYPSFAESYQRDLALRGNIPSAEETIRLLVLYSEGGVSFHTTTLPPINEDIFKNSSKLQEFEKSQAKTMRHYEYAKQLLIVEKLIAKGELPHRISDIAANEIARSTYQNPGEEALRLFQTAGDPGIHDAMKHAIQNWNKSLFQSLGQLKSPPGGLALRSLTTETLTNVGMLATQKSENLAFVLSDVAENLALLKNSKALYPTSQGEIQAAKVELSKELEKRYSKSRARLFSQLANYRNDLLLPGSSATEYLLGVPRIELSLKVKPYGSNSPSNFTFAQGTIYTEKSILPPAWYTDRFSQGMAYDKQIIINLQKGDRIIDEFCREFYEKHPLASAIWVRQADGFCTLERGEDFKKQLTPNSRVVFVGHGGIDPLDGLVTIANLLPKKVGDTFTNLGIGPLGIGKIVLFACAIEDTQLIPSADNLAALLKKSYGATVLKYANENGLPTQEVSSFSQSIAVDRYGRKYLEAVSEGDKKLLFVKPAGSGNKLIFSWDNGNINVRVAEVGEGEIFPMIPIERKIEMFPTNPFTRHLANEELQLNSLLLGDVKAAPLTIAHDLFKPETLTPTEHLKKILAATKEGVVITAPNTNAILFSMASTDTAKIIVVGPYLQEIRAIMEILEQARNNETQEDWLKAINKNKSLGSDLGDQLRKQITALGNTVSFERLQTRLAEDEQVTFYYMDWREPKQASAAIIREDLDGTNIAAIYLGDQEIHDTTVISKDLMPNGLWFKANILALMDEETTLYRWGYYSTELERFTGYTQANKEWPIPIERPLDVAALARLSQDPSELEYTSTALSTGEAFRAIKDFDEVAKALREENNLGDDWVPVVIKETEDGTAAEITLVSKGNKEPKTVTTDDPAIVSRLLQFKRFLDKVLQKIQTTFQVTAEGKLKPIENLPEGEALDGLNAAFSLQFVISWCKRGKLLDADPQGNRSLQLALEIHTYINLVQMAHGVVLDAGKVISLAQSLVHNETTEVVSTFKTFTRGFATATTEGLTALLGIANVTLDSIELAHAASDAEKATFATQLAFDTTSLLIGAVATGAAFMGATGFAAGLSGIASLAAGAGIGITALVQAFSEVAEEAKAVGQHFYLIDHAYKIGYEKKTSAGQTFMSPPVGAVIDTINFRDHTLAFGTSFIYSAKKGCTPTIILDKSKALSIRDRLGYPIQKSLDDDGWEKVSTWILPATPSSTMNYGWTALPFATSRQDPGFSVLRKLADSDHDFYYDFYCFPSHYTITSLHEEYASTTTTLILDAQQRVLLIPKFEDKDAAFYKHIHYTFEGSSGPGGQYYIGLNKIGGIEIKEDSSEATWILSAQDLPSTTKVDFTTGGIQIAGIDIKIAERKSTYLFLDAKGDLFTIDFKDKTLNSVTIDYSRLQQQHTDLAAHLKKLADDHYLSPLTKITNFPQYNAKGGYYEGTAYYVLPLHTTLYCDKMWPDLTKDAILVQVSADNAYFYHPRLPLLWSIDNKTHQLQFKFVFFDRLTASAGGTYRSQTIDSVTLDSANRITIKQTFVAYDDFNKEQPDLLCSVIYQLIDDQPVLYTLFDDRTLKALHDHATGAISDVPDNLTALISGGWILNNPWDSGDYPDLGGDTRFAQMSPLIAVFSFPQETQEQTQQFPVWVRRRHMGFDLIRPQIPRRNVFLLGLLQTPQGEDVFYFFAPKDEEGPALLGRLTAKESEATLLKDLHIDNAFWVNNAPLLLTTEHTLMQVDAFGQPHLISFTADWVKAHPSTWWQTIQETLKTDPSDQALISVLGITDPEGNALAVWYHRQNGHFILVQPPTKNGQQAAISYLGEDDHYLYFFSDGALYKQRTLAQSMALLFQGTTLKQAILPLVLITTSIKQAYWLNQRLWVTTEDGLQPENGLLLSFDPLQENPEWVLEKVLPSWVKAHKSDWINAIHELSIALVELPKPPKGVYSQIKLHTNYLVPIEETTPGLTTLWVDLKNKSFFRPLNGVASGRWHYVGIDPNGAAHFFDEDEKKIYLVGKQSDPTATGTMSLFDSELAQRFGKTVLLLLKDRVSLPCLANTDTLVFQVSNAEKSVIPIDTTLLSTYQSLIYQPSHPPANTVQLSKGDGEFFAKRNNEDIVIFHNHYPCLIFLSGCLSYDETISIEKETLIQLMALQNKVYEQTTLDIGQQLQAVPLEHVGLFVIPLR